MIAAIIEAIAPACSKVDALGLFYVFVFSSLYLSPLTLYEPSKLGAILLQKNKLS